MERQKKTNIINKYLIDSNIIDRYNRSDVVCCHGDYLCVCTSADPKESLQVLLVNAQLVRVIVSVVLDTWPSKVNRSAKVLDVFYWTWNSLHFG